MLAMTSRSATLPLAPVELAERPLGPRELQVAVAAASVNPVDWKMREASFLGVAQRVLGPSGPFVCGIDFAGVVTAVGREVGTVHVGDHVVGGVDFSRGQRGSYASSVTVREDQIAVLPRSVDLVAAACLPVAGVAASLSLFEQGELKAGHDAKVLVLGASGGVGHLAIQLARNAGAEVHGVCSSRNRRLVERLGARHLDYAGDDFLARAAAAGPFDLVLDAVGTNAYPIRSVAPLLAPDGRHVLVMPTALDIPHTLISRRVRALLLGRPTHDRLVPLVEALANGTLEVVIGERMPLVEAERAHELSRAGRVAGKIVLLPA